MSVYSSVMGPIRSLIASLIARVAPDYYRRIIERRHRGVRVLADGTSDVRELKEQALMHVMEALEPLQLEILAKIDDRNCWILLIGVQGDSDDLEPVSYTHLTLPTTDVGWCWGGWGGA